MRLTPQQAMPMMQPKAERCQGIDYIAVCTSNLVQAAYFYRTVFGFQTIARTTPQANPLEAESLLMRAGFAHVILTSPLHGGPVADHLSKHGEGLTDIALRVNNVKQVIDAAQAAGAAVIAEPQVIHVGSTTVTKATVSTCGPLQHTLLEYDGNFDPALAGLTPAEHSIRATDRGIERVDHVAIAVESGTLNRYCDLYCNVFGLDISHTEEVRTSLSAMNSKVIQNEARTVRFTVIEATPAAKRSQVEEFIDYHHGPGAQHVAFLSRDIVNTVKDARNAGVEFLQPPAGYYDTAAERVERLAENLKDLEDLGILVDGDDFGYLLQIFTKPVQTVPTFFIEIIQRRGAIGFGSGNIGALFQALEKEQSSRNNL